jgi:hypothetical protein
MVRLTHGSRAGRESRNVFFSLKSEVGLEAVRGPGCEVVAH